MNDQTEVRIRRAPKLSVFLVLGALAGFLATLIVTSLFPADKSVGFAASLGYFSLFGIPAGVAVGATIGLVLDAISRRRAKIVTAEREVVGEVAITDTAEALPAPKRKKPKAPR